MKAGPQKIKVILSYIKSSRIAWVRDPIKAGDRGQREAGREEGKGGGGKKEGRQERQEGRRVGVPPGIPALSSKAQRLTTFEDGLYSRFQASLGYLKQDLNKTIQNNELMSECISQG